MKHDVHLRLELTSGKTEFDGVFAQTKQSKLHVEKSKISPIMNGIKMIIDITKGGVIDRSGSFVWWMTELESPTIFKSGAWWSIDPVYYNKYKVYWDKIGGFDAKFRQTTLYEKAAEEDSPLIDLLHLIWLDLISERYTLQSEICKPLKEKYETNLIYKLSITDEELKSMEETEGDDGEPSETSEAVSSLAEALDISL